MAAELVVPGMYRVLKGYVNAYVIEAEDGLTLIDSGLPKREERVAAALRDTGHDPSDLRTIVVTHHHVDHVGSLAGLVRITGARVLAPAGDAAVIRGEAERPGPNKKVFTGRVLGPLMVAMGAKKSTPTRVDEEIVDGRDLDVAGGLHAIHTPGHTAGHTSFMWKLRDGVLIAGDAAGARGKRAAPPTDPLFGMFTEDHEAAKRSFRLLSELDFEVAVFGHGNPITSGASEAFRRGAQKLR